MPKHFLTMELVMMDMCMPINCKEETFLDTRIQLPCYAVINWELNTMLFQTISGHGSEFVLHLKPTHVVILLSSLSKTNNPNMNCYVPVDLCDKDYFWTHVDNEP